VQGAVQFSLDFLTVVRNFIKYSCLNETPKPGYDKIMHNQSSLGK